MADSQTRQVNESDLKDLKCRMKLIEEADASQYQNEFALKRYLRAFKTTDEAFKAILKTNKWRKEYGIAELTADLPIVKSNLESKKARVLRHRDIHGRPIIYIPARNHNASERNLEEFTKFIVYCLEEACKKCFEEVIDNLCIIFDLQDFGLNCMDYQIVKNMIWLLGRHYPERLGVCLVLNSPALFFGCWAVIKGWLDDNTTRKVKFVSTEEELCNYLIPDIMPTDM